MRKLKYTLYTEEKNVPGIIHLVDSYLDSYTISRASGRWRGEQENSILITYIGSEHAGESIQHLAEQIKALNKQESVIVESVELNSLTI